MQVVGESINKIDFEMLYNLIQSLRDQDSRIAEWVNQMNLNASTGKTRKLSGSSKGRIVLSMPQEINISEFEEGLFLKIAEVNGEPTRFIRKTKKYEEKARKSEYKRIFKTLGDYAVESYKENLVFPTLKKFTNEYSLLSMNQIKINHNNVSHTKRLNLIVAEHNKFRLTSKGIQLKRKIITFMAS